MLELYRAALRVRRQFGEEPFAWMASEPGVLTFKRGKHICVVNLSDQDATLPPHECLVLASHALKEGKLTPDTAAWLC
jgi:alpha-glucosidase